MEPKLSRLIQTHTKQPQGSQLFMPCSVLEGSKPLRFSWYKNQEPIHNDRYLIETKQSISHLTIHEVVVGDSGNYSCVVSNEAGFDTQWTVVDVQGSWRSHTLGIQSGPQRCTALPYNFTLDFNRKVYVLMTVARIGPNCPRCSPGGMSNFFYRVFQGEEGNLLIEQWRQN